MMANSHERHVAQQSSVSDDKQARSEPLAVVFDEDGVIQDCSTNCENVVGYSRSELVSRHISKLILQFALVPLFVNGQVNPRLDFLSHCGVPFSIQHRQGRTSNRRMSIVQLHHANRTTVRVIISSRDKEA